MHCSLRTETVDFEAWVKPCPQCKRGRVMDIETILPLALSSSSVVTYRCLMCGMKDDVLIEE